MSGQGRDGTVQRGLELLRDGGAHGLEQDLPARRHAALLLEVLDPFERLGERPVGHDLGEDVDEGTQSVGVGLGQDGGADVLVAVAGTLVHGNHRPERGEQLPPSDVRRRVLIVEDAEHHVGSLLGARDGREDPHVADEH